MSRKTEIIMYVDRVDAEQVTELSVWLLQDAPRSDDWISDSAGSLLPLAANEVANAWGGFKWPTATLWAGVCNYLDIKGFLAGVERMVWKNPDAVQVFLRDEGDPWFRVFMIRAGAISQFVPAPPPEDQERPW